jgi:hypothetical protein
VSLTVDISLTQIAFIAAETSALMRRLFPGSQPMLRLAGQIDRFTAARADTLEARICAAEVLSSWAKIDGTAEHRALLDAHKTMRGLGRQDYVLQRLQRLAAALREVSQPSTRKRAGRRPSVA